MRVVHGCQASVNLSLSLSLPLSRTAQQTKVKTGIAAAAKVPVDNVDLKKDARRAVTYTATGTCSSSHYTRNEVASCSASSPCLFERRRERELEREREKLSGRM